jgi:hypothetical protein
LYNRYIPQQDGSYKRSRIQDTHLPQPPKTKQIPDPVQEIKPAPVPPHRPTQHRYRNQKPHNTCTHKQDQVSAASFLRKLLPKEFDTGDLMIVLLLLLMAGDCTEDRNTALLTLALYFFM